MDPSQREPRLRDKLRGLLRGSHHSTSRSKKATLSVTVRPSPPATPSQPARALQPRTSNGKVAEVFPKAASTNEELPKLWAEALEKLEPDEQTAVQSLPTSPGTSIAPTIDEIRESIVKQGELHEEKKWTIEIGGKTVVLRDKVQKIVAWLNKFKEVGDIISSYDPVHLALPWAGMKFLIQAAVVENEQMEALIVGLETITYLMNRCMIYETLHLDERQQETKAMENLRTAIVALYTAILRFFAAAIKIQNDHSGVRTLRALLNPDKISNLLGECQKWAGDVHVEAELCEQSASHAARGEMRERDEKLKSLLQDMHRILENRVLVLWERSEVEEYVKIVQWISSIPFEDVHNDARAGRTGGTGNWLLEHPQFQEWRNTSDASVLWICGSPGTGKTKLVSTVVDALLNDIQEDEALAYFYCDRNKPDHRMPEPILRSFLRQLATSRKEKEKEKLIQPSVLEMYRDKEKKGWASTTISMKELAEELRELVDVFRQTVLVLDAFDECEDGFRAQIIETMEALAKEADRPLKILISSRPDSDVRDYMRKGFSIEITDTDNADDISRFIKESVYKRPTDCPDVKYWRDKMPEEFRKEICDALVEKSKGMFQWAKLQILHLRRLESEKDIRNRLGHLPETLESAYHELWADIQKQSGEKPVVALRAFRALLCALEPLSPHHLLFAASQDPDSGAVEDISMDLDYLLSACKNLLLIDPLQNTCRLSHLSVYEYFEKHVEKASVSHAWLARVCLATVMAPHAENIAMCRPGESFTEWATTRYDKYVQNSSAENGRDYPENPETYADSVIGLIAFTCYSNYYWPLHVKAHGDEDPCRHLAGLLALFLGSMEQGSAAFDSWAEKLDYYWQYPRIEQSRIPRFNPKDHKPIYTMAFFGFYNILSDWWDAGYSDVNHTSYLGVTLLKAASLGNSLPVVKWLLDAGADVNASDSVWGTALIRACSKGNYEVAELLLQRGADPDVVLSPCHYPGPENAISDSISQGNILITQLLLANGATLPDGFCIHTAAYARNKEMLSLLMQPSVRFKEPRYERNGDYSGVTDALIEAVKRNDEEIVRHMVKEGADVEAYTLFQQVDAITAAAFLGLSSMVQVLVDLGANVNTPLVSLIQAETTSENVVQGAQREAMVMLLLSLGADPSIPGGYERGALASAVHMCQFGIAKILLEHDPSLVNTNEGKSLLPVAVSNHDLKTVQLLIDYGADVNAPYMSEDHVDSESEQTESDSQERKLGPPLLEAANAQNHAITLLLLEKGASVEIDSDTASPLTAAAEGLAEEVVKTLLDWKMNVHHQHRESGQNALMALIEAIRELYKRHAVAPWQDQPSASFAETMDKARRISNLLLEHHIDVNARGGQYGSALAAAASVGDFAFTELLLKHGADVHARGGKDNVTALIAAVEGCRDCRDGRSYEAIIDLLLENGANVNTPGGRYGSALSAAVDWAYERDNDRIRGGGFNWDYSGWYEEIPFNEDDITAEMQREEAYLDRGRRIAETLMGRDTNLTERAENAETEGNLPQRQ